MTQRQPAVFNHQAELRLQYATLLANSARLELPIGQQLDVKKLTARVEAITQFMNAQQALFGKVQAPDQLGTAHFAKVTQAWDACQFASLRLELPWIFEACLQLPKSELAKQLGGADAISHH